MRLGACLMMVALLGFAGGCVVEDNEPAPEAPRVEINRNETPDLDPRTDNDIDVNRGPGGVRVDTPNVDVNVD